MASWSVNLTKTQWNLVQDKVKDDIEIVEKIDKHQRAKENLTNTITRKNKLIKTYESDIERLKNQISEMDDKIDNLTKTNMSTISHTKKLMDEFIYLGKHFNILLELIEGCDSDEKLELLKEMSKEKLNILQKLGNIE